MPDTIDLLAEAALEKGMELKPGRSGVWRLYTTRGVFDIGPKPTRGPEWWNFFLNLKAAGMELSTKEVSLMDVESKDGWEVKVRLDGADITDDTLEGLWAATRGQPGSPYGVSNRFVDDDPECGNLVVSDFSVHKEFRAAVDECLDRILFSIEASGMGGQVVSMTVRRLDHEQNKKALQEFITDLMGNSEVAEMLKVSRQRVSEISRTHEQFPQPVAKLASGPVYAADDVKAFVRQWERRRTGRPPKNKPRGEQEAR